MSGESKGGAPDDASSDNSPANVDLSVDRNPYTPGRPIGRQAMFFGRQAEHLALHERMVDRAHSAVVGPAEIGVSSLLRHAAAMPMTDDTVVAYADLNDAPLQTPDGLVRTLWDQWSKNANSGATEELGEPAVLDPLARRLAEQGHKLVAILDEYEQLLWRPSQFDTTFHTGLEALAREGVITLVTGTHTALAELYHQTGNPSPLYELPVQQDLGLVSPADALALLITPVSRAGLDLPPKEAAYFVDLAGAHPLFLHLAGFYLFAALDANRFNRDQVEAQFRAAAEPFWQDLWLELPPPARASLSSKNLSDGTMYSPRQVRTLGRKGIVLGEGANARLFSRGFAVWSHTMQQAAQLAREATAHSGSTPTSDRP